MDCIVAIHTNSYHYFESSKLRESLGWHIRASYISFQQSSTVIRVQWKYCRFQSYVYGRSCPKFKNKNVFCCGQEDLSVIVGYPLTEGKLFSVKLLIMHDVKH